MSVQNFLHRPHCPSRYVFLICFLALGLIAGANPVISAEISGIISLPNGDVAPSDGYAITISAMDDVGTADGDSVDVEITAGTSSTTYSLTVVDDTAVEWRVSFYSSTNGAYLDWGVYAADGTKESFEDADLLPGGTAGHIGIDMELLTGKIIAGTVSLPTGQSAPAGGISLQVYASIMDGFWSDSTSVFIPAGATSVNYSLAVNDFPNTWQVSYITDHNDYVRYGFYSAGGGTTWNETQAANLTAGQGTDNINMTLSTGKILTGIISLPAGQVAENGDYSVSVDGQGDAQGYRTVADTVINIAEGKQSAAYSLRLPDDSSFSVRIRYDFGNVNDYIQAGYYASNGTTWDNSAATILPCGQQYSGIDMTLLKGKNITGTISMPGGLPAQEIIAISITALDVNYIGMGNAGWSDFLHLQPGSSSVNYSMLVPDDPTASWQVSYSGTSGYVSPGYYATGSTPWNAAMSTLLPGGKNYTDINMTLIQGKTISGTIFLPPGMTAGGQTVLEINAEWDGKYNTLDYAWLQSGSTSASYSLVVPNDPAAKWRVSYLKDPWIDYYGLWWDDTFLTGGYYAATGTTWKRVEAGALTGGTDYTGIDLTILTGQSITISGSLSLPANIDPTGYQSFTVGIYDADNHQFNRQVLQISPEQDSVTYSFKVPAGTTETWRAGYTAASSMFMPGYYTPGQTVKSYLSATPLTAAKDHSDINMIILLGTKKFPWSMFLPAFTGGSVR